MKRHGNDPQETAREFYQRDANRAVIWISDDDGRIVDELDVETRIRGGEGGCQLCHESLDGNEAHGEITLDGRGLPRVVFGPGGPICADCVEWVRWLGHYAGREPLSTPRFQKDNLVLRAGTEEIYQILDSRLMGLPAIGIWFPVYRCQRIEVGETSGEILPACMGLEFEFVDFELQPIPPGHPIAPSRRLDADGTARSAIDLVGVSSRAHAIEHAPGRNSVPRISAQTRRLLPGKAGGP